MEEENTQRTPGLQEIMDLGAVEITNRHGTIRTLTVAGQIEGHIQLPAGTKTTAYEHILPLLAAAEESDTLDGLLILLNTVGGDIEAGLAIAEMIAGMRKPTVTLVLGGGHSIGIPLAVSARVTMIAPSASMTVHPVRMGGMMIAAPQSYRYFERLQRQIIRFVTAHSQISPEKFRELMLASDDMANDVGSVIYGDEAVAIGLMDRIGTLRDALDALYAMIEEEKNISSGTADEK